MFGIWCEFYDGTARGHREGWISSAEALACFGTLERAEAEAARLRAKNNDPHRIGSSTYEAKPFPTIKGEAYESL